MEFATTVRQTRTDDSYHFGKESSIVRDLPISDFLIISAGAILGANARWVISRYAARILGPVFPYGTLFINVSGSFVVGFFMIWASERVLLDPRWRFLVVVGFCGAFTTFSSFAFETMAYFEQGQFLMMPGNFLSNNLLCLGAVVAGMAAARSV